MVQLREELQSTTSEKDHLLAENAQSNLNNMQELERLHASTEERDQLLETVQQLREDKKQLKQDLDEKDDMVRSVHCHVYQILASIILVSLPFTHGCDRTTRVGPLN